MSLNYIEIARAAREIESALECTPGQVIGIDFVSFPNKLPVTDLCIALQFRKNSLVFSLKQPWVGMFWGPSNLWKIEKRSWGEAFDGAAGWNDIIVGKTLLTVTARENDRIVDLQFQTSIRLTLELFSGRPNWHISDDKGNTFSWRSPSSQRAYTAVSNTPVQLFDRFEKSGENWCSNCYRYYLALRDQAAFEAAKQKSIQSLRSRLVKLRRIEADLKASLNESRKAEQLRASGELLKSVLYEYGKETKLSEIKIGDDKIKLDSQKTLSENLLYFFAKYKKLQRTEREVQLRSQSISNELQEVRSLISEFEGVQEQEKLIILCRKLDLESDVDTRENQNKNKLEKKWDKSGIRSYISKESLKVWVGRNHKENEELVIRLARGNDLWFHVKGRPGAHVILQVPSGKSASLESLLDAACLAAYYSDVPDEAKVEVDYTHRKYVKRVPGKQSQFLVTYSQNKTLVVKVEKERVNRLLSGR